MHNAQIHRMTAHGGMTHATPAASIHAHTCTHTLTHTCARTGEVGREGGDTSTRRLPATGTHRAHSSAAPHALRRAGAAHPERRGHHAEALRRRTAPGRRVGRPLPAGRAHEGARHVCLTAGAQRTVAGAGPVASWRPMHSGVLGHQRDQPQKVDPRNYPPKKQNGHNRYATAVLERAWGTPGPLQSAQQQSKR